MLNIEYEFVKGFFFVRLSGKVTRDNYEKFIEELDDLISTVGLKRVVLNINNIEAIDIYCVRKILGYNLKLISMGILFLICESNMVISKRLFKNIVPIITREREALDMT